MWTSGTGVDLSSEGFCFCAPSSSQFSPGQYYETELTINFPHGEKAELLLEAVVRRVKHTPEGTLVGMQAAIPAQGEALARAVSRLQHQLSRRPEDYLMEERPRLRLH